MNYRTLFAKVATRRLGLHETRRSRNHVGLRNTHCQDAAGEIDVISFLIETKRVEPTRQSQEVMCQNRVAKSQN